MGRNTHSIGIIMSLGGKAVRQHPQSGIAASNSVLVLGEAGTGTGELAKALSARGSLPSLRSASLRQGRSLLIKEV
ncbi:hypothetical protein IQ238_28115 [Pleurocapsales cyanobacterium LEGE 06147]|nr:hypothetical protein [Pleurocapsales cyanobacterium LEGE 06147]